MRKRKQLYFNCTCLPYRNGTSMCHILYMFMKIHNNKFLINTMWNTLTAPLPFNTSGK